jgi:hypothetical protein
MSNITARQRANGKKLPRSKAFNSSQALTAVERREVRNIAKGIVNGQQEVKHFQFGFTPASALATGFTVPISQVVQGYGGNTRDGDRITPLRLRMAYSIVCSSNTLLAAADQYDNVRVIVFRWHDDSTPALPTMASILTNAGSTDYTLANYNRDQAPRYKVLYDRVHLLVNTPIWNGAATLYEVGPGSVVTVETTLNLGKTPIDFQGALNTGSEQLFFLYVSDSGFTPHPQLQAQFEVAFYDD